MASILEIIPEDDLKDAIKSEYKRKFTLYKITDEKFRKKYAMSLKSLTKKTL